MRARCWNDAAHEIVVVIDPEDIGLAGSRLTDGNDSSLCVHEAGVALHRIKREASRFSDFINLHGLGELIASAEGRVDALGQNVSDTRSGAVIEGADDLSGIVDAMGAGGHAAVLKCGRLAINPIVGELRAVRVLDCADDYAVIVNAFRVRVASGWNIQGQESAGVQQECFHVMRRRVVVPADDLSFVVDAAGFRIRGPVRAGERGKLAVLIEESALNSTGAVEIGSNQVVEIVDSLSGGLQGAGIVEVGELASALGLRNRQEAKRQD